MAPKAANGDGQWCELVPAKSGSDGAEASASAREPMLSSAAGQPSGDGKSALDVEQAPAKEEKSQPKPASFLQLFRYASPCETFIVSVSFVAAIVQGCTPPAVSFFLKDLFQAIYLPNDDGSLPPNGTGSHDERDEKSLQNLFIFIGIASVAFTCSSTAYSGFGYVSEQMSQRVKQRFLDQLLRKHVGWYDIHGSAEMATRLTNDTYDFSQGVGRKMAQLLMGMAMAPAGFAVAFTHDWRLSLMMFIAIPFMCAAMAIALGTMGKNAAVQQELYAKAGATAETAIGAIRTVAAFGGFRREHAKYEAQLAAAERRGIRIGWCNGFTMGFCNLAIFGTFGLGFFAGSILIVEDYKRDCWRSDPPFGTCFTGSTLLATLFAVLYGAIGLGISAPGISAVIAAKAAAARIYEVIDEPPAFDPDAGEQLEAVEGRVEFREVTFAYPSRPDSIVLQRASFQVPAGQTVAFVGPSGSGKSTVIALLQRFYDPTEGAVLVDGRDVRDLSLSWLRTKMAFVQQEPVLFSGTIQSNIAYGAATPSPPSASSTPPSRAAIEAAAKAANAHDFIQGFPEQYQTEVGERGAQLSGGQKQRIAIARAILRDPAILLLDEATSALDTESERLVQLTLDNLLAQKARTTFVVAHRLSTVRGAHRIYVLEDGQLVQSGSHEELIAETGSLYAQLIALQELVGEELPAKELKQRQLQGPAPRSPKAAAAAAAVGAAGGSSPLEERREANQLAPEGDRKKGAGAGAKGADPTADTAKLPGEVADDEDVDVSVFRLWWLQRKDWGYLFLGLLCTIPVGAGRPLIGLYFSETSDLFSRPCAVRLANGTWIGSLDTEELTAEANKQCVSFAILSLTVFLGTWGQLGGFRHAAEALTRRIRSETFHAMLKQEIGWFDSRTTGHLTHRLASEAPLIKSFTGESLALVLQLLVCVGSGVVIALWASWRLTLSSLAFVPLVALGQAMTEKNATRQTKEADESAGPMVSETLSNIRTVASFGLRPQIVDRYSALLELEHRVLRRKARNTAFASAYSSSSVNIMFGGIVFIANIFIGHGWVVPGNVAQVLFPVMFAASGVSLVTEWRADKEKARLALNHIFSLLDRTPLIDAYQESGTRLDRVKGEIHFDHVAFRYPSRLEVSVFEDFDLRIEAHKTVAFCGPSGSGKSTTIALLQRFYDPLSGAVRLDGHDLRSLNLGWLRQQMAFVQQEPVLFAGTIMENIAYGREGATEAECRAAAVASNAHSFVQGFAAGYETDVGERGTQLSGGQKQRIAIARSIVRSPPVLLLDEATSALDTESERLVQEALDRLLADAQRTTLVVAHRLSTIVGSDMICMIYDGRIVEKGRHEELMAIQGGHYRQLAERQRA